jgi:hypothetical protein
MRDDTYNGWTNRETWCVALWLNNEEALQEGARSACNTDGEMLQEAARSLEDYVTDLFEELGNGQFVGFTRDLLRCALAHCNFQEVAASFRE